MATNVDPFASIDQATSDLTGSNTPKKQKGYDPFTPVDATLNTSPTEDQLSSNIIKDTGIKLAQGAIDLGDSVVGLGDMVTGGNVSPVMESIGYDPETAKQMLSEGFSGKQKLADQRISEAEGFADTALTALENPRSIWGTVAQSTPLMLGGMGASSARANQIMRKAAEPFGGMNTAAGKKAAQAALDRSKNELILTGAATEGATVAGMTAAEAEREGREYEDYALPALGSAAATTLIGGVGGRLFGDAATGVATKTGGVSVDKFGRAGQAAKSAVVEGGEELLQESTQQVFNNIALGNDPLEGVEESAAMGMLAGGVMGAGMGAIQSPRDAYDVVLNKGMQDLQGADSVADPMAANPEAPINEQNPLDEAVAADAEVQPQEKANNSDLVFTSAGDPFPTEHSAKTAATNKAKLRNEQYEVVAVPGGFALKPVPKTKQDTELLDIADQINTQFPGEGTRALETAEAEGMDRKQTIRHLNTRFDELSNDYEAQAPVVESDRVNAIRQMMNDAEAGSGDAALQEAIDSGDMNEAQAYSYLRSRQQKQQKEVLATQVGNKANSEQPAEVVNEQQAQTEAEEENTAETAGTQAEPVEPAAEIIQPESSNGQETETVDIPDSEQVFTAENGEIDKPNQETSQANIYQPEVKDESPKLPSDIARAKPRYNYGQKGFALNFESDIDRAAFIAAKDRKSKRDADYVKFVSDNTGMSEDEVRAYGKKVSESIKSQAKDADAGELTITNQQNEQAQPVPETEVAEPEIVASETDGNEEASNNNASEPETAEVPETEVAPTDAVSNEKAESETVTVNKDDDSLEAKVWTAMNKNGQPTAEQVDVFKRNYPEWYAENVSAIPDAKQEGSDNTEQDIDAAANESAESPTNDLPEPSEAQKEAGNYKMGHAKVAGLDITIENPKGSKRKGINRAGEQWENEINNHYGYIRGSVGKDKDHVDVFLGDTAETADRAYVIDQVNPDTGAFDEHKVMIGFANAEEAKQAYLSNYDKGWKGFKAITDMPMADFKEWVKDPKKTSKPAAEVVTGSSGETTVDDVIASNEATKRSEVTDSQSQASQITELTYEQAAKRNNLQKRVNNIASEPSIARRYSKAKPLGKAIDTSGLPENVQLELSAELKKAMTADYIPNTDTAGNPGPEQVETNEDETLNLKPTVDDLRNTHVALAGKTAVSRLGGMGLVAHQAREVSNNILNEVSYSGVSYEKAIADEYARDGIGASSYEQALKQIIDKRVTDDKTKQDTESSVVTEQVAEPQSIGKNADGIELFEDQDGVRYYVEGSIRVNEPVGIQPTRAGNSVSVPVNRRAQFKTEAELAAEQPAQDAGEEVTANSSTAEVESVPAQNSPEYEKAQADMENALSDLGEIFLSANLFSKKAKPAELNATDLMPVLTRVMDAAFRMGYHRFKQNARFVLDTVRDRFGDAAADSIMVDDLQGAYIAMKKGTDSKLDVINVESIDEIMSDTSADENSITDPVTAGGEEVTEGDTINETEPVEEVDNDAGRNETSDPGTLENVSPAASEELETEGLPERSPSSSGTDTSGNGRAKTSGTGRTDSVDGNTQSLLHSEAANSEQLANSPSGRKSDRPNKVQGENPGNFVITDDLDIGGGTTLEKINRNIAAINTLKSIEAENRFATTEEQKILAQYVGWGGLKQVFDIKNAEATGMFGKAYRQLKEALTEEEYRAAFATVKNAHYTAKGVVDAMWRAVNHFGFAGGRALEPTVGTGNFIGMQPENMAASTDWHAAELDSLTGRIAKHLYPESKVLDGTGFQDAPFADGVFDLAIGNPPFGSEAIRTKRKQLQDISGMKIHNFVIAKSGKHLRPGGVMAMVVTHRFLDTANPEARNVLAKDFKFMGAIRLPNDAFMANANTEVTTDIIFLQKLHADEKRDYDAAWLNINGKIDVDGQAIKVNKYFEQNPTHILGRSAMDGSMYRGKGEEYTVHSDGRDLGAAIDEIIQGDWSELAGSMTQSAGDVDATAVMLEQSDLPVGGMVLNGEGKILRRDLDDDAGNAVIEEITAETLWKDNAASWEGVYSEMDSIRDKYRGDFTKNVDPADVDRLIEAGKFAYLATGNKKSSPTKAEKAVYDTVDAALEAEKVVDLDGKLSEIEKSLNNKRLGQDSYNRLRGLLDLRNKTLGLIHAEYQNDNSMNKLRKSLNEAYDAYVAKYGFISDKKNLNVLAGDVGAETGLEKSYQPAINAKEAKEMGAKPSPAKAEKADILETRVNFPHKEITTADTPHDALHISLSERGNVDLPYMAGLLNKPTESVIRSLSTGEHPEIFFNPSSETYEHADEYLSGNVRRKLQLAREAGLDANVSALEAVQPAPLGKDQVTPSIRGQWIPKEIFTQFLRDLGMKRGTVSIIESIGQISVNNFIGEPSDLGVQFQDKDKSIEDIFNAAASGKTLNVWRKGIDDKRVKDETASQRVNALVARMTKVFSDWAYSEQSRVEQIVDAYNEKMNTHRSRTWDGVKYLKTVGAVPESIIRLRVTQKNAAWRMIQSSATLLDHVVGAGKTFTVITGVMQRRRLGLSKKPMIAVPNHLVVQWAVDFYKLYPGAKVLAATPDDFAKNNRRRLFARIATGDYDAIIIGHSSLGRVKAPDADQELVINEEVDLLKSAMEEARANGDSKRTLSQMQNRLDSLNSKLKELSETPADEIGIDFASMGIDYLSVDEAHEFKNLAYSTSSERVVGMNDPKGSQSAFHLYTLVRGLQSRDGAVSFATGTPVSNTLVELYTMMTYMANGELKQRNQLHFDAWSGAYTQTETKLEYTATQKLKPRRVLSGLSNLESLRQLYEQFADMITMDDLKRIYAEEVAERNRINGTNERTEFPVPKVKNNGRILDSGPITPSQKEFMDYLVARMQVIETKGGDRNYPKIDNPLNVLTDARKMSLDIRTVDPEAPRDENGKVMRAARHIKRIYDAWNDDRGTQMVFSDMSTPSKQSQKEAKKLVADSMKKIHGDKAGRAKVKQMADMSFSEQWQKVQSDYEAKLESDSLKDSQRESLEKYFTELEDVDAVLMTADTGFSVYDDLRTVLNDMGVPDSEVAFIHDYPTPEKKQKLFARVNAGYIRVLIGSTAKMGAGTNAQERLVAEHHLDAPWRPSDVEQREGRIIRQGNMFYERDPDGFEVEIIAYSTEGTSDTVMWQILERKAAAIEQFRKGGIDKTEEEGADSDQYAEFMASSTGNPVFKLKLEAERNALDLQSEVGGMQIAKANAKNFMQMYERDSAELQARIEAFDSVEIGIAKSGSHSGSIDELNQALEKETAEYDKAYAKYLERKNVVEKMYDDAEAAGESTNDLPNIPAKPPRPSIARKPVQENSGYARAMADFFNKAAALDNNDSVSMSVGNLALEFRKSDGFSGSDTSRFALFVKAGDQRVQIIQDMMKAPINSPNMIAAVMPKNLTSKVNEIIKQSRNQLRNIESRVPIERQRAEQEIDTQAVDDANKLAEWYRIQVSLAEVEADRERADKPNKYIAADKRRPIEGFKDDTDKDRHEFIYDGETFTGTGLSAKGSAVEGDYYDAIDEWANKAVVIAKKVESKDETGQKELEAVRIIREPELARKQLAAEKEAKTDLKSVITDQVNGLNQRAALKILNENKLLARLIKSGKLKVQRDSSGRQGSYGGGVASVYANNNDQSTLESTAWHEVTHAAMDVAGDTFINPKVKERIFTSLQKQVDAARKNPGNGLIDRAIARADYAKTPEAQYLEEIAAYLVTEYVDAPKSFTGKVLDWVKDMLAALKVSIMKHTGLVFGSVTAQDMKAIAKAYASRVTGRNYQAAKPVMASRANTGSLSSVAMPTIDQIRQTVEQSDLKDELKRPFQRVWQGLKSNSFMFLTLRQMGDVTARILPDIKRKYIPVKDMMEVEINRWRNAGGEIARERTKLSRKENMELSEIQHDATLNAVDPSKKYHPRMTQLMIDRRKNELFENIKGSDGKLSGKAYAELKRMEEILAEESDREKAYNELLPRYNALSRQAQRIYMSERDYHADMNKKRREILEERIEGLSMSDATRRDLLKMIQEKFESFEVAAPYFPLSRYGEFWAHAMDRNGEPTFNMFETESQRDQFIDEIKKQGYTLIGAGKHLENMDRIDGVSSEFVSQVDGLISKLGDHPAIDDVRKQVYDLYLQSLPELSARKHFIRRKKTAGFHEDQSRAFADAVQHGSRDIAKLQFAHQLDDILRDMRGALKYAQSNQEITRVNDQIKLFEEYLDEVSGQKSAIGYIKRLIAKAKKKKQIDKDELEKLGEFQKIATSHGIAGARKELEYLYRIRQSGHRMRGLGNLDMAAYAVDEMGKTHDALLNPNVHPVAQILNSFGFVWFLGLTPAAAFINTLQTPVISMPLVASRHGVAKTAALFNQATKDFFHRKGKDGYSVENAELSLDEHEAFKHFYEVGLLDNTLAHDTAGIAENGIDNGSMRHKVMNAASYMFHRAEQFNREVTALASYRAARESGNTHEQAIQYASDVVYTSHFDYTAGNRSRMLRGNVMRVVAQFKQYSQSMIYLYGRLGYRAFKGEGVAKSEARKALTGILAMQFALAGAAGLPLSGFFMGLAQLIADLSGDDDEPFLVEAELRAAITHALSSMLGESAGKTTSHALSQGLVNALTPLNLSGRISHSDMLIRMSDRELGGRDAAYDTMKALGGVATSYIEMPFVAIDHLRNENYSKAVETMLPKFAKDIVKAGRFATDDARTARGYLLKDMSLFEVAAQMTGFSSSKLADTYNQNNARTNLENRLKERRSSIIDHMVRARSGDGDLAAARRDMEEWNKKNPKALITYKTIRQSERGRQRYEDRMIGGKYTTDRYMDIAESFSWAQ